MSLQCTHAITQFSNYYYAFFAGYDNVSWIIGPDYKQLSGSFVNYKTKGTGIPQTGWSYYDAESKTFIQDDTSIVVKGKYL